MKHIFKKLHHHPNRSNETPQPPAPPPPQSPSSTDNRTSSSSPAAASTTATTTTSATHTNASTESNNNLQHHAQQDYYASEEEYQVQLALALSVSSSGQDSALIDPGKPPIRTTDNGSAAADLLSRRYWVSSIQLCIVNDLACCFSHIQSCVELIIWMRSK